MAGFRNDQIGILRSQLPVLGVARQGGFHLWEFLRRNIAGVIFAIPPILQLVVGTGGPRTIFECVGGELSQLHGFNRSDFLKNRCFGGWIHIVPSILVTYSQKTSRVFQFEEFCLTPVRQERSFADLTSG